MLKRRTLFNRICHVPAAWRVHYRISRRYTSRWGATRIALRFCWLTVAL